MEPTWQPRVARCRPRATLSRTCSVGRLGWFPWLQFHPRLSSPSHSTTVHRSGTWCLRITGCWQSVCLLESSPVSGNANRTARTLNEILQSENMGPLPPCVYLTHSSKFPSLTESQALENLPESMKVKPRGYMWYIGMAPFARDLWRGPSVETSDLCPSSSTTGPY